MGTSIMVAMGYLMIDRGFTHWQRYRLMMDTPTEKVRSMAAGRTKLNGVIRESDQTVDAGYTDADCVYVYWEVEIWNHNHGSKKSALWNTVASGEQMVPFELEDETGRALVRPEAEEVVSAKSIGPITMGTKRETTTPFEVIDDDHRFSETFTWGRSPSEETLDVFDSRISENSAGKSRVKNSLFTTLDILGLVGKQTVLTSRLKRQRFTQYAVPVDSAANVLGSAQVTSGTGQQTRLEIRSDGDSGEFVIADVDEATIYRRYRLDALKWVVVGILFTALYGSTLAVMLF